VHSIALATTIHPLNRYRIGLERTARPVQTAQFRQLILRQNCGSMTARSAVYATNIAMPAANIATVVIATKVHPKRELGWPCISLLSEATTRIATRRKGANNPLMTAVL
jgi:hypothetical protein